LRHRKRFGLEISDFTVTFFIISVIILSTLLSFLSYNPLWFAIGIGCLKPSRNLLR